MLDGEAISKLFLGKKILVTGGLGSIGSEIVRQLIQYDPKLVRIIDNRETELFYSRQLSNNDLKLEFLFGDVRDKDCLDKATDGIDIIFHAAAMKHVIVCEYNPAEAIKTNVIGTQNVITCAIEHNVERMVLISTDKVVNPTNVMGATKLLAERLVSAISNIRREKKTKFGVVRFGNVLASRGSVLEIWDKQLREGKKISITNPDMTRFFMSIPESVKLVFNATYYAESGETFILKMPSIRIKDLAEVFLISKGYPKDYYEVIGVRAGEKLHEGLLFEEESGLLMSNDEMLLRLPLKLDLDMETKRFEKMGFTKSDVTSFSSKDENFLLKAKQCEIILSQINQENPSGRLS
jgi:UDP-N-acetylglucosamine 4,6-dehydratase/5-epimerase